MGVCVFYKQTYIVQLYLLILSSWFFFSFFAYTYTSVGGFEDPVKSGMSTDFCAIRALIVDLKTIALWFETPLLTSRQQRRSRFFF